MDVPGIPGWLYNTSPVDVRIFQGYFDAQSEAALDPSAEPIDIRFNLGNPLYECNLFTTLIDNQTMRPEEGPVGLLSWKFRSKTRLSVQEFSAFCKEALGKGADVAFINPMLEAGALYSNVWEQGEFAGHRGLLFLYETLFPQLHDQPQLMRNSVFAFCNYFVGNARFWNRYRAFCDDCLQRISDAREVHPQAHELIHSSAHYVLKPHADFRPFILERLFSTFLLLNPDIVSAAYPQGPEYYALRLGKRMGDYFHTLACLKERAAGRAGMWEQLRRPYLAGVLESEARRRHLASGSGKPDKWSPIPRPRLCFFTLQQEAQDFAEQLEKLCVAAWSLLRHTSLRPVLLYDGGDHLTVDWLAEQGVEIIRHRSVTYPRLRRLAAESGRPELLDLGLRALAKFDLCQICQERGWPDRSALVCDCDVFFRGSPDEPWPELEGCAALAAVPGKDMRKPEKLCTAVMLLDIPAIAQWIEPLRAFLLWHLALGNTVDWQDNALGLFFSGGLWSPLPAELNWRPAWGLHPHARIVRCGQPEKRRRALAHHLYKQEWEQLRREVQAAGGPS